MENVYAVQKIRSSFNILKYTFVIVPIVAGIDKFTNVLTDWAQYVSPSIADMLPVSPHVFMMIVGVIEIIAGIIVYLKAEIGGYIVAAWLGVIAISLLVSFNHLDVAVRDLVMAVVAFVMARQSENFNQKS